MSLVNKKNKITSTNMDDYMISISNKYEKIIPVIKNPSKMNDEDIIIPTIHNYNDITKYNYNTSQLKIFTKKYKLKVSGTKKELLSRIFGFLYLSSYIVKIQKVFRGTLQRTLNFLHGPAAMNRKLCTNSSDFITLEPIEEIEYNQFFSYKDVDGFIYGFDIVSLYNLSFNSGVEVKNPYNRSAIPLLVLKNIRSTIKFSSILKKYITLQIEDDTINISGEKVIELRTLALFQNIDALGNYSDPQWFNSLSRNNIIKFVRDLSDIWNYRAQLTNEVKRKICPPNGDPFRNLSMPYIHTEGNMTNVRKVVLEVLEKMVNTGIDQDSRSLGSYYVLGALTLVNETAATSLPWLFQSVSYF